MAIDYLDKQLSFLTDWFFQCEIFGETASKANSRKIVKFGNRPASIKSDKARAYEKTFASQCVTLDELVEDDVLMWCRIYYASRRPDLDESLIMDLLQGRVIKNDRQIKAKVILHALDKENPRAEIRLAKIPV
mgnify:CR=1 FL=1|tara:strand:- start:209 stop:607 length:399 start_codon:yes stop_codon:yes gene_type:complete